MTLKQKNKLILFVTCYLLIGLYGFLTAKLGQLAALENIFNFLYYIFFWPFVIIIYFVSYLF